MPARVQTWTVLRSPRCHLLSISLKIIHSKLLHVLPVFLAPSLTCLPSLEISVWCALYEGKENVPSWWHQLQGADSWRLGACRHWLWTGCTLHPPGNKTYKPQANKDDDDDDDDGDYNNNYSNNNNILIVIFIISPYVLSSWRFKKIYK